MTVSSTTNRKEYAGNGVTTSFSTSPVVFFASGDLTVYVVSSTGAVTTLTENTHYTVSGGGTSPATGAISTAGGSSPYGAPATGTTLVIVRDLDIVQETDFVQNDGSDADVSEAALDRAAIISQQLAARLNRTLRLSDSDATGLDLALPDASATSRAGTIIGLDALGTGLELYSPSSAVTAASNVTVTQAGTGAVAETVQTALRRWCWAEQYGAVGDGVTDDSAAIVRGWTAGFTTVRLMAKNYKINTGFVRSGGQRLVGEGKANTTLTLGADIVAWDVANVNDTGLEDLLIVPYSAQTNPVIRLTAATVTIARNNFRGLQIAGTTQNYRPIQLRATGAFGIWANNFTDMSFSGVGTVVELNTSNAAAWIRENRFRDFYVNDFIIGVDFIRSAGDGASENAFEDWAAQASARTTYGFRIPASSAGQNQYNVFDQFNVYDLTASGVYYDIGLGVIGTEIRTHTGQDLPTTSKFVDKGTRTKSSFSIRAVAEMLGHGHCLQIPTAAGWTEAVTGSGSTTVQAAYNSTRTGTTLNSTARRYTETIGGFAGTTVFGINYDKPAIFRFNVARATSEANAVGRVQLKGSQAEGAMATDGLGLRVSNYALYGESCAGATGAFVDLSTTMTDVNNYQIEIRHYPADRVEWWVNGVYKASQTDTSKIPSGTKTAYLVHSLVTTVSNPSGDAQMFLLQPWLWSDL